MLEQREDGLGQKYRADVCVEGSDQHRGWFQSQLLTAVGSGSSSVPYKALVTHGMVLDQKGKKMSKSLGNVISPITVVAGGKVGENTARLRLQGRLYFLRIKGRNLRMEPIF